MPDVAVRSESVRRRGVAVEPGAASEPDTCRLVQPVNQTPVARCSQ